MAAGRNNIMVRVLGDTKGLSRALRSAQEQLGGLDRISSTLGGGLRKAGIAVGAFGAAAVAAGAVGAAALAAIPLALAGGVVAVAAFNENVKKAFGNLGSYVKDFMNNAVKPLVPVMVTGAGQIKAAFKTLEPAINSIVKMSTPLVKDIFGQIGPLAKQLGPLLVNAFKAGAPVLKAFIAGLSPLIKGFSEFFAALGGQSGTFAAFMTILMKGIGSLLGPIGQLLAALAPLGTMILKVLVDAIIKAAGWLTNTFIPAVEKAVGFITKNKDAFLALAGAVALFFGALKGIQTFLALKAAFAVLATPVGLIALAIAGLVAGFIYLFKTNDTFRGKVLAAWDQIKAKVSEFVAAVWPKVIAAFNNLKAWWEANGPAIIAGVMGVFNYLKDTLGPVITQLVETVKTGFEAVKIAVAFAVDFLIQVWNKIAPAVVPILKGLWEGILGIIKGALEIIQGVFNIFIAIFTGNWGKAWTGIKQVFHGIWTAILGVFKVVWNVLKALFTVGLAVLQVAWKHAWNAIKAFFGSVWTGIKSVASAGWNYVKSGISSAWNSVKSATSSAWNAVKSALSSTWAGIKKAVSDGINNVLTNIRGIKGKITGVFSGAGSWLLSAGRNILQGLLSGITDMIGKVRGKLQEVTSLIPDWKGPAKVDKKLLYKAGQMIMGGLIDGIDDQKTDLKQQLRSVTKIISGADMGMVSGGRLAFSANAGVGGAGTTIEVIVQVPPTADKASIGREIKGALDEWARVNGR